MSQYDERKPFDLEEAAANPEVDEEPSGWAEPAEVTPPTEPYAAEDDLSVEDVVPPVTEDVVEEADPEEVAPGEPESEPEPEMEPAADEPEEAEPSWEADPAASFHTPGGLRIPDGYERLEGEARGERRAVAVVVGRFNGEITTDLLRHALDELELHGVVRSAITVMPVPGAFELPIAAMALAKTRKYACIVALGCVIRGETPHFEYVANEAASGLQLAALETGTPVAFGLLTCETIEQARARVNRGADAARSALEMADLFAHVRALASSG